MSFISFGERIVIQKTHSGKMLNQYLLLSKLGQGSSSKIYLARDSDTSQNVAIKTIHLKSKMKSLIIDQVIREIRIFHHIEHSNVIQFKETLFSEERRIVYLVMEFASFGSLDRILNISGKISESLVATIFRQVIQAIVYLNENRIVHHDLKPMNILLTKNGKAKLSDFGLSSSFESGYDLSGSPAYQAPEIFDSNFDDLSPSDASKIDVWSLGVSMFESVFGILPFEGDDAFQIFSSTQKNPVLIPLFVQ
jgi:serine/threonine protein kinase